jgi:hypothetical protein
MGGSKTASEFSSEFAVTFRLFTEQVELVLLVAVENVTDSGFIVNKIYSQ